jgi:hypothetical protein
MRHSTYVRALFQRTVRIEVITKETNSLCRTNIKTEISHLIYTGWNCNFLTSTAIMEVQMGEMSKLG